MTQAHAFKAAELLLAQAKATWVTKAAASRGAHAAAPTA